MAKKKTKEDQLTRPLRAEIVGSPDMTWGELGPQLRAWRSAVSHLINEAVFRCREAERAIDAWRESGGDESSKPPPPATAAYQAVIEAECGFRAWAKKSKLEESISSVSFGGATQSCIGRKAYGFFQKWKKNRDRIPSASRGQPIPCRAAETKISEDDSGKIVIDSRIAAGDRPRTRLILSASSGWHWDTLRKIASGEHRHGQVDIVYDERARRKNGGKGKWYALISYSFAKPKRPRHCDPEGMVVVHRGMHNFLQIIGSGGEGNSKTTSIRGNDLLAFKRRCFAIRRSMGRLSACERGSGAKGHGKARRYEHAQKLLDSESRYVKTKCQQAAARVVQLAHQWRKSIIVIEDYGGIDETDLFLPRFPYYQLKLSIICAAESAGLSVREVSSAYVSQTCPRCGNQDASQHLKRTGMFHCTVCEFSRPADLVAAIHLLRLAQPAQNGWDEKLRKDLETSKKLRNAQAAE
jgi:transposase